MFHIFSSPTPFRYRLPARLRHRLPPKWYETKTLSQSGPCFPSPPPCPLLPLSLLLLLFATIGSQCHDHWSHHFTHHKSSTFDAPSIQICQACKAFRFSNVCESTLFDSDSLPFNPFPFDFILAIADSSAAGLQTTRSMIHSILDASEKASNINRINTARICLEVLSYSDYRLSAAFSTALPADALDDTRA